MQHLSQKSCQAAIESTTLSSSTLSRMELQTGIDCSRLIFRDHSTLFGPDTAFMLLTVTGTPMAVDGQLPLMHWKVNLVRRSRMARNVGCSVSFDTSKAPESEILLVFAQARGYSVTNNPLVRHFRYQS